MGYLNNTIVTKCQLSIYLFEPGHEKICLMSYANNKGTFSHDEAHLFSAFGACLRYNLKFSVRFMFQQLSFMKCGCILQTLHSIQEVLKVKSEPTLKFNGIKRCSVA